MLNFIKTKKTYLLLLAVLFVFITLSETTYSLFLTSNSIAELDYNTGLLDLQFTEDEQIVLEKTFPINDSDATSVKPYVLKVKNTGTLPYLFDLNLISTNDNAIDSRYIKVKVNDILPNNLLALNNKIATNNIIYPGEEKSFKISIWLDISTPNNELGKKFIAKIVTSGSAIYKTNDTSDANYPSLKENMIPIYYDENSSNWLIADSTNSISQNKWYAYNEQKWANVITLKDSNKLVYDLTRNNDLNISNIIVNDGNLIIDSNYLNIGLSSYDDSNITSILKVKFNDPSSNKIYLISNSNLSYYYDTQSKTFVIKNNNNTVISDNYTLEEDTWYTLGYSYDTAKVTFYANGNNIGTATLNGQINKDNSSFLVATDSSHQNISKLSISTILIYNRILKDSEISSNYYNNNIIKEGLISGYNEFTPMTLTEYYKNSDIGTIVNNEDVLMYYVWIPRYKYRIWNILGDNTDSYNAYTKGIDIIFEKGVSSTGEITCQDNPCTYTTEDNNKYYTHKAFSLQDEELTGFWVSKYEISTTDNRSLESKPENTILHNNSLSDYYKLINNNQIIKNTDWGAITYLSHSVYGVCKNNKCENIEPNTSYISGNNEKDTTTLNMYGVFDLTGGAAEYTMSNYTTTTRINTLFKGIKLNNKDYELYQIDSFILGDATKEIMKNNTLWYNSTYDYQNPSDNWIVRGGDNQELQGIFSFTTTKDNTSDNITTRLVLK